MKEPKISVVMTAYNVENYIEKAMDSVLSNTYNNIELIVVEDCSTDNTLNIINKFDDERIKLIRHEVNKGAGLGRRTGIEASTGEYIITIDADDTISNDFLESLVKRADETDADIVSGGMCIKDVEITKTVHHESSVSEGEDKFKDFDKKKIIFLNNKLVRRSLYATAEERLNNTPNKVVYSDRRYCEDTPTMVKLIYYANKIAYCTNDGYIYNMRNESLTHTQPVFREKLYLALCAYEMFSFLNDKEDVYQKYIPGGQFIQLLKELKDMSTPELLKEYHDLWVELTLDLISVLNNTVSK